MNHLLIVDDDQIVRKAHHELLRDHYQIDAVDSGESAISFIEGNQPDVVLIDIELPDVNGFEVTRRLTASGHLDHTAVIFVSRHRDFETQVEAFSSGGDDFISKPLDPDAAIAKIQVLINQKKHRKKLEQDLAEAQKTVMTAISNTSELGLAMHFVEQSFGMFSIDQLGVAFCDTLASLGLKTVVSIYGRKKNFYFPDQTMVKPIEQELIELLRAKDRFFDFGQRTQINYPNVSVLIKNMPVDDYDRYGRVKDLLPAIIGCLDARVTDLEAQENILSQASELVYSFDVIQTTMRALTGSLGENQSCAADRLHQMVSELEIFVQRLGLEEDQERSVIEYIDDAVEDSLRLLDSGDRIFDAFEDIMRSMKVTVDKQNTVVKRIEKYREEKSATTVVEDELF